MRTRKAAAERDGELAAGSDFYVSVQHQIRRAHQIGDALFAEELGHFDVTPLQYAALTAIAGGDDLDATRVSRIIALDRSTLGNVLERLESKGLIAREYRDSDKRTKRLRLTESGRRLLRSIAPAIQRSRDRFSGVLKREEQESLRRLLSKLIALHAADEERLEHHSKN